MKRKICLAIIICMLPLLLVLTIIMSRERQQNRTSELYKHYQYPNEDFYGKNLYSEIDHKCSEYETEIGNVMIHRAVQVAEFSGTEQDSEVQLGDVGELSRYYYFNTKDAVTQNVSFEFITCNIDEDQGHIWVASTIQRYNANEEILPGGGKDILCLWYIEHHEDAWNVVRIQESP